MKKIFAIFALSAATTAFANPTVTAEFDRTAGSESKLTASIPTYAGTFDYGVLATRYAKRGAPGRDEANGYEVGYSNGFALGKLNVVGRVGYGKLGDVDAFNAGGGFKNKNPYRKAGIEVTTPLVNNVSAFANYSHRNTNGEGANQNKAQLGADFKLNYGFGLRAGISHAKQAGETGTGLIANINYTF